MKDDINLRDYFTIGRDVLRSCWNWHGPYFNGVPWLKGRSARRLVRKKYGNGVEPGAHVSRCLLGNAECVNPAHTYSSITDLEHLHKYIGAVRSDGCRLWMGATKDGYPLVMFHNRTRRAARVLWQLKHGPIPRGFFVCHSCDEPRCMNIGESGDDGHLWLGTAADNNADMVNKGRAAWQKKGKSKGALSDG